MAISLSHKIYFFVFNLTYMAIGVTMLGYGLYSIIDMQQYGSFSQNTFIAGSAIFIAVGVLKIVFSIIGMVATFVKSKALLAVYVSVIIFLMFWTFIAAIYAFQTRPSAYQITQDRLTAAYTVGSNETADILTVQNNLNCCGVNDPQEVINLGRVCTTTRNPENVYGQGCLRQLGLLFVEQLYQVGAIGMAFGVFEVTSLMIAMQTMQGQ